MKLQYGLDDTSGTNDSDPDIPNNNDSNNQPPNGGVPAPVSQESHESLRLNRTIDELNPDKQLEFGKSTFGEGTKWAEEVE